MGTSKSSILMGFSIIYKPSILGYPYFWKHPKYVLIFRKGNSVHFDISACQSLKNMIQPQRLRFFSFSDVRPPTTNTREIFMEMYFPWKNEKRGIPKQAPEPYFFCILLHVMNRQFNMSKTCPADTSIAIAA